MNKDFLTWHYSYGVNYYFLRVKSTILQINHQLSLRLLMGTLFSPWKRLLVSGNKKGFHPMQDLEEFSFNAISRVIGAVVRILLFLFGVFAIAMVCVIGGFGFLLWLALPFLSYSLYKVYKEQPQYVVARLYGGKDEINANELFKSEPGRFLLAHLGDPQNVVAAFPEKLKIKGASPLQFEDLMANILENNEIDQNFLRAARVTKDDLALTAKWWTERKQSYTTLNPETTFEQPGIGLSLLFGYTPTLDKYVSDMGTLREFTHHLIGREEAVSRIVRALTAGKGVMLTGDPGVGRKTVVYELAKRAREGLLGQQMSYKRILDFDYNKLIATSGDINVKKSLFVQMLKEASSAGNVILVIRDIFRITNSEVEGIDFTDVITQSLESKRLFILSILDKGDHDRYVARNGKLSNYFEEVYVTEITKEDAMPVMLSAARYTEKKRGVITPVPVLRELIKSSEKYFIEAPFPERALELLDAVVLYHEENGKKGTVTLDEVRSVLSEKTGIALSSLGEEQKKKLSHLEEIIHNRLVSQEYPISLIAKALRAKTSGVVNNARPIGSFLFLGPTGVGKTETAKALAELYFGSEEKIVRFDMSEYAGHEGIERLIGNVNKGLPGVLTTALKNNPACLLLLDEIEKAPSEVFNLFLSLLDEGRITDAFGKTVSAAHTFVIATSNAGSEYIRQMVQENVDKETLQKKVLNEVLKERIFTPEFVNRFDGVVVYEPLTRDNLKIIAKRLLKQVSNELEDKGVTISFDDSIYNKVVEEGYDPALGARPMRRMIELKLGDAIAQALLSGEMKEGDKVQMSVDEDNGGFVWKKI